MRCIILILLFCSCKGDKLGYRPTPYQVRKTQQHSLYSCKGKIVFIGDSIFDEIQLNELFGRCDIVNRSAKGYKLEGVKNRIDTYLNDTPKQVVMMIGINDLMESMNDDVSHFTSGKDIYDFYNAVSNKCKALNIPFTAVCPINVSLELNSMPYVRMQIAEFIKLAKRNNFAVVNINPVIAPEGILLNKFTNDGLHLLPPAITVLRDSLQPILVK